MKEVLFQAQIFGALLVITPWKLVGYLGVALFAGRWLVQMLASRAEQQPMLPRPFWYLSITGSLLLLAYFTWGQTDSVGLLSNLFPLFTALYNLRLDILSQRGPMAGPPAE